MRLRLEAELETELEIGLEPVEVRFRFWFPSRRSPLSRVLWFLFCEFHCSCSRFGLLMDPIGPFSFVVCDVAIFCVCVVVGYQ